MNKLTRARNFEKAHLADIKKAERPVYHVSPAMGWMNDPNGFSYYNGKYHLFYQYYPYATKWGTMHWGHYVTSDFIHWDFMPAALAPDESYESGCYSGSAVETEDGKHLIMYTAHLETGTETEKKQIQETQCIAVGDGADYIKYEGNPVLTGKDIPEGGSTADFRDPKIWIEKGVFYSVIANMAQDGSGQILLYSSQNGYEWKFVKVLETCENKYGEMWECPDFFRLDGKAVLLVSPMNMKAKELEFHSGHNVIGIVGACSEQDFDFSRENVQNLDYGFDFYAAQTTEAEDGRRIMTAWMQSWESSNCQPAAAKWFSMLTFPRELTVCNGRIIQNPVRELKSCRKNKIVYQDHRIENLCELEGISGRVIDLELYIKAENSDCDEFDIYMDADDEVFTLFRCDLSEEVITVDRSQSGIKHDIVTQRRFKFRKQNGNLKLRFLIDRFSIELFVNDGEQVFTMCTYDTPLSADGIRFSASHPVKVDVEKYDIIV